MTKEKMTREEYLARLTASRPHWVAEEYCATRLLQYLGASGAKAYGHLKDVLRQTGADCEYTRWGVARHLLARALETRCIIRDPEIFAAPEKGKITGLVRESPFYTPDRESRTQLIGPLLYIVRMQEGGCRVVYPVQAAALELVLPPFRVTPGGSDKDRIVVQELEGLLGMVRIRECTEGLPL